MDRSKIIANEFVFMIYSQYLRFLGISVLAGLTSVCAYGISGGGNTEDLFACFEKRHVVALCEDISMGFIVVPAGTFMVGSPKNEKDRGTDENQVPVKLSSFAIGETEVTQAQFQSVMGYNPSINEGDNLPVSGVSWYEAMEFCHIPTAQEREKGRVLPGF